MADGGITPAKLSTDAKQTIYLDATLKTASAAITVDEGVILVDSSLGQVDLTMPSAVNLEGRTFSFILVQNGSPLNILPASGETVNGGSDYTLNDAYQAVTLVSDGTGWFTLNHYLEYALADGSVTALKLSNITDNGNSGQMLTSDGTGGFSWEDVSGVSYSADGVTLELNGDVFSIKDGGVDEAQLASGSVTSAKIDDEAVGSAKIEDGAVSSDKLASGAATALKMSGLSSVGVAGQILSSDGTGGFAWTDDADTAYAADGSTLELSANVFGILDGGVDTDQIADSGVTEDKLENGAVGPLKLSNISDNGTSGQVLASDGSGGFSWADYSDTTYTADGTTLKLDGTEFSIEDGGVDTDQLADSGVTPAKLSTPAKQTLYLDSTLITGSYLLDENDGVILADTTSSEAALTLPRRRVWRGALTPSSWHPEEMTWWCGRTVRRQLTAGPTIQFPKPWRA